MWASAVCGWETVQRREIFIVAHAARPTVSWTMNRSGGNWTVEWLLPWHPVADNPAQIAGMAQELQRELWLASAVRSPMKSLARRQDCNDVLFALETERGELR